MGKYGWNFTNIALLAGSLIVTTSYAWGDLIPSSPTLSYDPEARSEGAKTGTKVVYGLINGYFAQRLVKGKE